MGGEGKCSEWKKHPNIVLLTAREHFICHWLLTRIYPKNNKLAHAFWFMCTQKAPNQERLYVPSSKTYAEAVTNLRFSEDHKEKLRQVRKGKKTIVHPQTGAVRYIDAGELPLWLEQGWENTNKQKGSRKNMTEEGSKRLAARRLELQAGRTGLEARAAKGPYTVEYETGELFIAGSYPELSKLTGISLATIQHRVKKKPHTFYKGWRAFRS